MCYLGFMACNIFYIDNSSWPQSVSLFLSPFHSDSEQKCCTYKQIIIVYGLIGVSLCARNLFNSIFWYKNLLAQRNRHQWIFIDCFDYSHLNGWRSKNMYCVSSAKFLEPTINMATRLICQCWWDHSTIRYDGNMTYDDKCVCLCSILICSMLYQQLEKS